MMTNIGDGLMDYVKQVRCLREVSADKEAY